MSAHDKDVHEVRICPDKVDSPGTVRQVWRYDKELGAYFHEDSGYAYDDPKDILRRLNEYADWEARAKHLKNELQHIANYAGANGLSCVREKALAALTKPTNKSK